MTRQREHAGLLEPGAEFEKYIVERQLGRGGMGAVYLVRHRVLDSFFALKVLFPEAAERNRQFVDRFIREAKLACKIKHPNLIAVYDAGRNPDNGLYYLVMEYVPGGTVRDLLKKEHRIAPARALRIIAQTAAALQAAHRHHMVHRDIKPDNIMFAADGTVKLADLGIAKSTDEQDTMLTMAAAVFGTPAYMSPEQAKDSSRVDCRADIYSLGIVFYEMVSGCRPYRGEGTIQILSRIVTAENIPDVRTVCPEIPAVLAEAIAAMTEKDLARRIQTPSELLTRLNAIYLEETPPVPPTTAPDEESELTLPTLVKPRVFPGMDPGSLPSSGTKAEAAVTAEPPESSGGLSRPLPPEPSGGGKTAVAGMGPAAPATIAAAAVGGVAAPAVEAVAGMEKKRSGPPFVRRKAVWCGGAALLLIVGLIGAGIRWGASSPSSSGAQSSAPRRQVKSAGPLPSSSVLPVRKAAEEDADGGELVPDKLGTGNIVLMGDTGPRMRALRTALAKTFGSGRVAFRRMEGLSRCREELDTVIAASPAAVVLMPAGQYAQDRISKAGFENIIRYHADRLRDNGIAFCFLLSPETGEEVRFFNAALTELGRLRSIPVLPETVSPEELTDQIRRLETR